MSNKFISQYTADGTITSFIFDFVIVQGRSINAYGTLSGSSANEDIDLLPTNSYIVIVDNPMASSSTGHVLFNIAPLAGTIITITPDSKTDVTVNFSNTTSLNQNNLNKAYNQQSSTIEQDSENFLSSSLRYNINENEANINYDNKLPPLADKSFWRRDGGNIIAQDYDLFVNEVEKDVSDEVSSQVNAGAINTNIAAELAGNAINTPVSGDILKVDANGNVVVDKTITNVVSGLASAHWSKEWAVSDVQINDDFGNTGFSSKYYSNLSDIAATSTSGLIDELFIYDTVNTTSKINLIEYQAQPNKPWIDVLDNSFTLYIDGKLILSPSAYTGGGGTTGSTYSYTVTIKANPTLADPSYLTISPSVPTSTQITVSRGVAQGDSSTMFATGANYKPSSIDSKIANRDLSNVPVASTTANGVSRVATQSIVNNGTNTEDIVAPSTLRALLLKIIEPVGQVNFFYATTVPDNYLVMDNTHWSKTTYPELWAKLNGLPSVSSDATDFWINSIAGRFTRSTGTSNVVGSTQEDAIRNIVGNVGKTLNAPTTDGAFQKKSTVTYPFTQGTSAATDVDFDASRVVPTSTENRPVSYALLQCIKYKLGF